MKKYTVLLLYPDYISDDDETYLAHVQANSRKDAILNAQLMAEHENPDMTNDPTDFKALAVFQGHLSEVYDV